MPGVGFRAVDHLEVSHARTCEPAYEVVIHDGPLPARGEDPLTAAETGFRTALEGAGKRGSKYTLWASKARADWHKRAGAPVRGGE